MPRWIRAMDIPETKPGIYAYKQERQPQQFEAFSSSDSSKLESAFRNGEKFVRVEVDGLYTVDLERKLCRPTYWDGPGYAVHRALWTELANNKVIPLDPEIEHKIEEHFQHRRNEPLKLDWPSKDGKVSVSGTFAKGSQAIEGKQPMLVLNEKKSWISAFTKRNLYRGLPAKDGNKSSIKMRPDYNERDITHLVFCVHGIGQLLSVKFEQVNFVKDVDALRQMLGASHERLQGDLPSAQTSDLKEKNHRSIEEGAGEATVDGNTALNLANTSVQVLPVLWRNKLDEKINGLKPGDLFGASNLAADAVLDFVMYTEVAQRKIIQSHAAQDMNRMYKMFCADHPEFAKNPKVSIVGHSLGSVIAYDLINPEAALADLDFEVLNLFTLGSPIGVIDLIRQAPTVVRGKAKALYNIMRLADPVAARLEPLVTKSSLKVSPKPIPGGRTNLIKQVKELIGDISVQGEFITSKAAKLLQMITTKENEITTEKLSNLKDADDAEIDLSPLKKYNRHGRLDFSVQETMDLSLLLGLAGHLMYLDNPDVVMFILKEILENGADKA